MQFIIIGLGNFGAALGIRLTALGHEVIGVDNDMKKIDAVKDKITHTVQLDSTDLEAIKTLPYKNCDVAIVGIGEDLGASIMTTALLKQLGIKRLISRAISPLHETVIEAIGVDEIVHPEVDSADRLAKKLEIKGVVDSFFVSEKYNIIEATVPERYVGSTIGDADFRETYKVNIVTIIRVRYEESTLRGQQKKKKVLGVVSPKTVFENGDILVLFGHIQDIQKVLQLG